MSAPHDHEFLSLAPSAFGSDEEATPSPIQPHLDTLFAEFARTRSRLSPPRSPIQSIRRTTSRSFAVNDRIATNVDPQIDLRALDYLSDYDSHLMCPICHVPFVDPVVLDCDHTFCSACFEQYRDGAIRSSERSQCPTCRAFLLALPRKASRLIVNMCNDIKVRCPNEDCDRIILRGCVEQHATKDCPEGRLLCPDTKCEKLIKRKNFVPGQCIHSSHVECDCGVVIELGRGEWLKHKDEECPATGVKCEHCDQRLSAKEYLAGRNAHVCEDGSSSPVCPGAEYGCSEDIDTAELEGHVKTCPLARLAPHLKKQSQLVQALQEQLAISRVRNEVLETGLDKINTILDDQVLPSIHHSHSHPASEPDLDIEEVHRDHIPTSSMPGRSLLLPAHLRALTPSPNSSHRDPPTSSISISSHLTSLHESNDTLHQNVNSLQHDLAVLSHTLSDIEARSSMQLMNETLRLKEDLAHTNAALFSTRAQVQWLLNRERVGAQQAAMGMRGRTGGGQPQPQQQQQQGPSTTTTTATAGGAAPSTTSSTRSSMSGDQPPTNEALLAGSSTLTAAFSSAGGSSSSTYLNAMNIGGPSDIHTTTASGSAPGLGSSPRARPQMRRLSGGSQERVKL